MAERRRQGRHPRGRRRAAHHQRLRLLLLPQLGNVAGDGQVADGDARAGPRQGAHGSGRLAGIFASPLRAGDQGLVGEARRGALRRGTAGRVCRRCWTPAPCTTRPCSQSFRSPRQAKSPSGPTTTSSFGATAIPRPRRSSSATTANPSGRRSRCTTSPPGPGTSRGWPRRSSTNPPRRWPSRSAPGSRLPAWTRRPGSNGRPASRSTSAGSAMRSTTWTSSARCRPTIPRRCWRR